MLRVLVRSVSGVSVLVFCWWAQAQDVALIADFEGPDYGDWVVSGEAFGPGPAPGTLPNQNPVSGYLGSGLVNSLFQGDGTTGTLQSPTFTLSHRYMNVLVGGGAHQGKTCLNLMVGETTIAILTGNNNEMLSWQSLDLSSIQGQEASILIVDDATGSWGHINVDHIELSATARAAVTRVGNPGVPSRTMSIIRPYLHLPVKSGAPLQRMRVLVERRILDEFDIELAPEDPDFFVYLDMSPYLGKTLSVELDTSEEEADVLKRLILSDDLPGAEEHYAETYRPQFHFSPRRGWNNDPNGLVYFQGEYHLYFQHNPFGRNWGNMHWGHAVSRDLVHWEELPIARYPQSYGDWAFSGSAVVDWKNTGGFRQGVEPALVIAYTSTGRGECIAFSNDRGRTFTEYADNPVITHDGRDPKLIWHDPTGQWVMAVYEILNEGTPDKRQTIGFYTSPDLKTWTHQSNLDGYYECPELFELPVDGNRGDRRWVVYGADNAYAIGQFDGTQFLPESDKLPGNYGDALYAAQTFSDIASSDGRRIEIGWGKAGHPSMPFNQMMTFPTSLSLQTTPDGPRLYKEPVWEISSLYDATWIGKGVELVAGTNPLAHISGALLQVEATIHPEDAPQVTLLVRGVPIVYDVASATLRCGNQEAPLPVQEGVIHLNVLVDRLSVEIFANHGAVYMPMAITPDLGNTTIAMTVDTGRAEIREFAVHTLKSSW